MRPFLKHPDHPHNPSPLRYFSAVLLTENSRRFGSQMQTLCLREILMHVTGVAVLFLVAVLGRAQGQLRTGVATRCSSVTASNPPMIGIVISRIMTSGFDSSALSIASRPLPASPQISMSLRDTRIERTPCVQFHGKDRSGGRHNVREMRPRPAL